MMDYLRFRISEMHLGKFPDSKEYQSWKVNFKTEVCSKTADPRLAMQWIKEIEMAKSAYDTTINFGTDRIARLRYVGSDDCVCIEEAFR